MFPGHPARRSEQGTAGLKRDIETGQPGLVDRAISNGRREHVNLSLGRLAPFVGGLVLGAAVLSAGAASAEQQAVKGVVSGAMIQKVGFRAMIQKQAIMYNVAGYARNVPDGTVSISLQGDKNRIGKVLDAIRAGTRKSSQDNRVSVTDDALDPSLKTFTVVQWTSTTRNITNPYDLVFQLRPVDDEISKKEASAAWNTIAESTLKGDDLAKFTKHLDADD
jgi:acylphosphatase